MRMFWDLSRKKGYGSAGLELVHPDDMEIVNDVREIIFDDANAPVQKSEVRLRHKDGSWRIFEVTASNLLYDNIIEGAIVTLHDITERKRTEENLLMTQFAMNRASYNILWLNDSAKIIYANERFRSFSWLYKTRIVNHDNP